MKNRTYQNKVAIGISSGVSCSGVYCAVSYLIDMMNTKQEVDIYEDH